MSIVKKAKRGLLRALRGGGIASIVGSSRWRTRRLLILCYHGVAIDDEHKWSPTLYVSPGHFRQRMELIARAGCTVLPLDEAIARLGDGTLPPRAVALTFDDGAADFALQAHPILQEFGFPSTVYLTTFYCGRNAPVYGVFWSYVLWKTKVASISRAAIDRPGHWDVSTAAGRRAAYEELRKHAEDQRLSATERDALSERLTRASGLDFDALRAARILQLLEPSEVARLATEGVTFELHTHRHRTPNDAALFSRELKDNSDEILRHTGRSPRHFCYPSGVHEEQFLPWLAEFGVRSATTCETGLVSASDHSLILNRVVDTMNLDEIEFESWLSGVAEFLPHRRAYVARARSR
jgi:peptidoglycan/xylan/chitin deacetylase (PgdA/CDA1 family)